MDNAIEKISEGDYDGAILEARKVLDRDGESAQTYFILGTAYYLKAETENGIEIFEKVLSLDPNFKGVHKLLGELYRVKVFQEELRNRIKTLILSTDHFKKALEEGDNSEFVILSYTEQCLLIFDRRSRHDLIELNTLMSSIKDTLPIKSTMTVQRYSWRCI